MNWYRKIMEQLDKGQLILFTPLPKDTIESEEYVGKCILQGEEIITENDRLRTFWKQAVSEAELLKIPYLYQLGGRPIFAERVVSEPELVICGGGHISLELAAMASYMEFPFSVIDDREEFACKERFPLARNCICQSFESALKEHDFSGNPYYIIATRGHCNDLQCLEALLNCQFGYLGMIGSHGKVEKSMNFLRGKGYSEELLQKVHSPIGLKIGGQTPKEIAISIIAEIIQVKNQEQSASYLESEFKSMLRKEDQSMVLAQIIHKAGSAPRGIGAKMLVGEMGILCGTIGGGKIEYEAIERAKKLLGTGEQLVEEYQLNNSSAAALGMWCGGEVKVLFEDL